MYHEKTAASIRRHKRNVAILVVTCVLLVALLFFGTLRAQASAREQAAASLRNSIMTSAKQCCAIEGSYPSSVEYLEENYGLEVNHDDYIITYECFADNVPPSVVVVPR